MNYSFAHLVKLGHTHVKAVDLIIVEEAVVDPILCFENHYGLITEYVESPEIM